MHGAGGLEGGKGGGGDEVGVQDPQGICPRAWELPLFGIRCAAALQACVTLVGQPQRRARRLYVVTLKQSAALLGSCARGWIA